MRLIVVLLIGLFAALPAFAQAGEDETKVRAVIADWYKRVGQAEADRPYALMAPDQARPALCQGARVGARLFLRVRGADDLRECGLDPVRAGEAG